MMAQYIGPSLACIQQRSQQDGVQLSKSKFQTFSALLNFPWLDQVKCPKGLKTALKVVAAVGATGLIACLAASSAHPRSLEPTVFPHLKISEPLSGVLCHSYERSTLFQPTVDTPPTLIPSPRVMYL